MKRLLPILAFLGLLWATPALAQKVACANDFTGCTNGVISPGGGGAVSSVSSGNGSIIITPTTGAVVATAQVAGSVAACLGSSTSLLLSANALAAASSGAGGPGWLCYPGGIYVEWGTATASSGTPTTSVALPQAIAGVDAIFATAANTGGGPGLVNVAACTGGTVCNYKYTDLAGSAASGQFWWMVIGH